MSSTDYYLTARKIATELSQTGYSDWGARIINAIEAGSTATEILMGVRWHLDQFRELKFPISPVLESKISSLLVELDNLLK